MNISITANLQAHRLAEADDRYPNIRLNDRWRVIACRDGIQWILQARNRAETVARDVWRGRSYCRTRGALIQCCDAYCGEIDPAAAAVLAALPARTDTYPTVKPANNFSSSEERAHA